MQVLKIAKLIVQEPRYVEACKVIAEAEAEAEAEAVQANEGLETD